MISGPGGVGKGTLVRELIARDPRLVLSRSWTTRDPRPGEAPDAYRFVSRDEFRVHVDADGFLEHAEFLGNLYGTPRPEVDDDRDLVLEIDVQGAALVHEADPSALLIFMDAPSAAVQEARLRGRGDPDDKVAERIEAADQERERSIELGARLVVNDDLEAAIAEVARLIDEARDDADHRRSDR